MPLRRCYVTVLFIDLCNSTKLGELLDPEIYAELLADVRLLVEKVVTKHSGVVNQFYGDGVLAVFGLPEAKEDDVNRAIIACLELHKKITELRIPKTVNMPEKLQFHSGLDAGLVVINEGDFIQGQYRLSGDCPNTAARLSDSAAAGEILATESAIEAVLPCFNTQPVREFDLRGKFEAVRAYKILSTTKISTRFEASRERGFTQFVGREPELLQLNNALDIANEGEAQLISVLGEAGVGKTRLVEAFVQQSKDRQQRFHRIFCGEQESAEPMQPVAQLFNLLLALDGPVNENKLRTQLQTILPNAVDKRAESILIELLVADEQPISFSATGAQLRLLTELLQQLVKIISVRKPLIVVFEDWHNADDNSRVVLRYFLRQVTQLKLLIITTVRTLNDGEEYSLGREIRLSPFTYEESQQVIYRFLSQNELGVVPHIYQRSGGNALFIEELCRAAQGSDNVQTLAEQVPTSLHGLIAGRISNLDERDGDLINAAAVIGTLVDLALLERVMGFSVNPSVVEELVRVGLFYPQLNNKNIRFKHGVIRDALYNAIPLKQRQALHRRIAAQLTCADKHLEMLAYHNAHSGLLEQAIEFAEKAGDKALEVFALDRARYQYGNALRLIRQLDETQDTRVLFVDITRRYALASTYYPQRKDLDVLEYALACANVLQDDIAISQSEYWLGWIHYALGCYENALNHYQRSLAQVEKSANKELIAFRQLMVGQVYAVSSKYAQADAYFNCGLRAFEQSKNLHKGYIEAVYGYACYGFSLADRGEFEDAGLQFKRSLKILEEVDSAHAIKASVCALFGAAAIWRGNWLEALAYAERAQKRAERVNAPYAYTMGRAIGAYAKWRINRDPQALTEMEQSIRWLESKDIYLYASLVYSWMAEISFESGESKLACAYAEKGVACETRNDIVGAASCYRVLAWLSAISVQIQLEPPDYYFERAIANANARSSAHELAAINLNRARLYAICGRENEAQVLTERALPQFKKLKMDWHQGELRQFVHTMSA